MKVPKNIKNKINQQSSKFNYGYISEGNKDTNVNIYIYAPIFIAALYVIVKTWKWPKDPVMDEWINKMWNRYIILFSHKKERNLPFVTTWVDLDGIILHDITQRKTYYIISLLCGRYKNRTKQTHRYREQTGVCQGQGVWGGKMGETVESINFQTQSKLVLGM